MVDSEAVWNMGAVDFDTTYDSNSETLNSDLLTADAFYETERGQLVGSSSAPPAWVKRDDPTYHNGIGLPYPSDFGYATTGGTMGRKNCLEKGLDWAEKNIYECADNDWLGSRDNYRGMCYWSMTPVTPAPLYTVGSMVGIQYGGIIYIDPGNMDGSDLPTAYLNSSVKITGGSGTIGSPYTLSL